MNRKERRKAQSEQRSELGTGLIVVSLSTRIRKLTAQGRFDEAAEMCHAELRGPARSSQVLFMLGDVLSAKQDFPRAVLAYGEGLTLLEKDNEPHRLKMIRAMGAAGWQQLQRGAFATAEQCFLEALRHDPDDATLHDGLARALQEQWKLDSAVDASLRALAIMPKSGELLNVLGYTYMKRGEINKALAYFESAIEINPRLAAAHGNVLLTLQYKFNVSGDIMLRAAQRYDAAFAERPLERRSRSRDPRRKLRIGYVSGNFYEHPVAFFLRPILAAHDPVNFEVVCFSTSERRGPITDELRQVAFEWHDVAHLSRRDLALYIDRRHIDILVDLAGHTDGNALLAFAHRPAPIQVSWIGYSDTIGMKTIDYLLMDRFAVPSDPDVSFLEPVVLLPRSRFCIEPPDRPRPATAPPCARNGFVTFGSFNNVLKLNPETIETWAAILHANPTSRLLLKWASLTQPAVAARIVAAFAEENIPAERLILRGQTPFADMLSEYADVDVALDPFPFCGGATSCFALWMGVPVVTLPCSRPASRQTSGFLALLDLADLAATSRADYVGKATAIAQRPDRLTNLRQGLRSAMQAAPIM